MYNLGLKNGNEDTCIQISEHFCFRRIQGTRGEMLNGALIIWCHKSKSNQPRCSQRSTSLVSEQVNYVLRSKKFESLIIYIERNKKGGKMHELRERIL